MVAVFCWKTTSYISTGLEMNQIGSRHDADHDEKRRLLGMWPGAFLVSGVEQPIRVRRP